LASFFKFQVLSIEISFIGNYTIIIVVFPQVKNLVNSQNGLEEVRSAVLNREVSQADQISLESRCPPVSPPEASPHQSQETARIHKSIHVTSSFIVYGGDGVRGYPESIPRGFEQNLGLQIELVALEF